MESLVQKDNMETMEKILRSLRAEIESGAISPGTKLGGERRLCEQYRANVYQIRKVIETLKKEGTIYSVPKSGNFVSEPIRKIGIPPSLRESGNSVTETCFGTLSHLPQQQEVWNRLKKIADESFPFLSLRINYSTESLNIPGSDLLEYGSLQETYYRNQKSFLNLRQDFPELSASLGKGADDYGVPVNYGVPVVLYNRTLLKKLGFGDVPSDNHAGQMAFLDSVTEAVQGNPRLALPGSSQYSPLLLGRYLRELYDSLEEGPSGEKQFRDLCYCCFEKSVSYFRKYRIGNPKDGTRAYMDFLGGKTPFFFGMSSDYAHLSGAQVNFEYGTRAMFAADDACPRAVSLLTIRANSHCPMECFRIIRCFLCDEMQKAFAGVGYLPLAGRSLFPEAERNGGVIHFRSPAEYYVCMNILGQELWNMILFGKSLEDSARDSLLFSRSYLQYCMKMEREKERFV